MNMKYEFCQIYETSQIFILGLITCGVCTARAFCWGGGSALKPRAPGPAAASAPL